MPKAIAASRGRRASGWMTGGVSKCDLATILSNLSAVGWGLGGLLGLRPPPPAASEGDAVAKAVTTSQQVDCVVVVAAIERLDDLEVRGDLASPVINQDAEANHQIRVLLTSTRKRLLH